MFQNFGLDYEEVDVCRFDRVGELVRLVGWIRASEDPSSCYDAVGQDGVVDLKLKVRKVDPAEVES